MNKKGNKSLVIKMALDLALYLPPEYKSTLLLKFVTYINPNPSIGLWAWRV